jgi:hypothetical protein
MRSVFLVLIVAAVILTGCHTAAMHMKIPVVALDPDNPSAVPAGVVAATPSGGTTTPPAVTANGPTVDIDVSYFDLIGGWKPIGSQELTPQLQGIITNAVRSMVVRRDATTTYTYTASGTVSGAVVQQKEHPVAPPVPDKKTLGQKLDGAVTDVKIAAVDTLDAIGILLLFGGLILLVLCLVFRGTVGAWVKYVFGLLWKAICALPKIFSGGLATVEADFKAVGSAIKTTGTVIVDDIEGKTAPPVPTAAAATTTAATAAPTAATTTSPAAPAA